MTGIGDRYERTAQILRLIDGDTIEVELDLGFSIKHKERCRLYGVDTPEVHGVKKASEEYARGVAASAFARDWLLTHSDRVAKPAFNGVTTFEFYVVIRSHDAGINREKYGRWLVEVFPASGEGPSLNQALIDAGHATAT